MGFALRPKCIWGVPTQRVPSLNSKAYLAAQATARLKMNWVIERGHMMVNMHSRGAN